MSILCSAFCAKISESGWMRCSIQSCERWRIAANQSKSPTQDAFVIGRWLPIALLAAGQRRSDDFPGDINLGFENFAPKLLGVCTESPRGFFVKPGPEKIHGDLEFALHFFGSRVAGDGYDTTKCFHVLRPKTIQFANQYVQALGKI